MSDEEQRGRGAVPTEGDGAASLSLLVVLLTCDVGPLVITLLRHVHSQTEQRQNLVEV